MKKLLVGTILLPLSLTMSACNWDAKTKEETPKKETVVKSSEEKTESEKLDKKSEAKEI